MKRVAVVVGIGVLAFCVIHAFSPSDSFVDTDIYNSGFTKEKSEEPRTDSPDEFFRYFKEISTMEGSEYSGYRGGYKVREFNKALRRKSEFRTKGIKAYDWLDRGPGNVPGRTRGLIILPDDPTGQTWLAGSASGGIWKTIDGGISWENKTPDLPNLATTVIALSESNLDIIYAGTGEAFSNLGAVDGDGMFKSLDGGDTWTHLESTTEITGLLNINRIIVDPTNPDILLACGNGFPPFESGVYKSVDGGNSWVRNFVGTARVQQLLADPDDFNIQYATINNQGIVKSVDGGDTWVGASVGLNATGRIEMAISPVNSQRLFAAAESVASGQESAAFVSDDGGDSWQVIGRAGGSSPPEWLGSQGWYDNAVAAHPFDEDIFYIGGIGIYKIEVTDQVTNKEPAVTGVVEDGTEAFMDWINSGNSQLRGGLGTGLEWYSDNPGFPTDFSTDDFTSVEIRFGPGKKQMAHRFTVPLTSGTGSDGGAGVIPTDHLYQDYVEVPFEVWDTDNDRQLMVSFRDQERDGKWNLITRSETDPVPGREYIFVNGVTYDSESAHPSIASNAGQAYKTLYCMWPTLAQGAIFDDENLPESALIIKYGAVEERVSIPEEIVETSGVFNANLNRVHPDIHNIQIFSSQAGLFKMVVSTDGGVYQSNEEISPGEEDSDWFKSGLGYNTTQFYGVDKAPGSSMFVGGTQDNGTWITFNVNPNSISPYSQKIGGDGFEVAWSYFDPNLLIGGSQYNRLQRSVDGGNDWSTATNGLDDTGEDKAPFITRLESHKLKPQVLLAVGESGVWRSNNFGENWISQPIGSNWVSSGGISSANRAIFSKANPDIIWAGGGMTSERSLHVSSDGGLNYSRVPNVADTLGSISGFATHPTEPNTAYVLFSFAQYGKIFRTMDLGQTWEDISGFNGGTESLNGFPDVQVNTLLVLPHEPETILVGTGIGIFESNDNGESWHIMEGNIPSVSIFELIAVDDQLVAATHGRGIWSATVPGMQWPVGLVAGVEDELNDQDLQVYPNPANAIVTLSYQDLKPGPFVLSVVELNGSIVYSNEKILGSEQGEFQIETQDLAEGIYVLNLKQGAIVKSARIMIKH